jgi:phosphoribosylanthranilate isomerase
VNQPEEELLAIAAETRIQVLQLHGDEPPALCARLPLPVVKAIPVDRTTALSGLLSYEVAAFLLDTPSRGYGGSGAPFDWSLAEGVSEVAPVILAGGLHPENVAAAIRAVRPYAVDVASGVESSPGVKDMERMSRFVAAVREVRLP